MDAGRLGCGCQGVERKNGVALLELAGAFQACEEFGQFGFPTVFDDDDAAWGDQVRGVEQCEDLLVLGGFFVGRVEEDKIGEPMAGRHFFQAADSGSFDQLGCEDVEGFEVFADQSRGLRVGFDENCFARAAADGFDANGAGSGEEVNEQRVLERGAEDVEEGFAQAIAGGAKAKRARTFQ